MQLPEYFIVAGDIHVGLLDANGQPTVFRNIGECPSVEWDATEEYADNWATGKSGPNLQDLHAAIKRTANLTLMMKERTAQNLELLLGGNSTPDTAGSYTANEALPTGLVAGDEVLIPGGHVGITALVIKDSAGSPATVATTKYSVNPDAPLVTLLDVTGFTQPFKAFSYSYVTSTKLTLLEKTLPEVCIVVDGKNLAPTAERVWARINRVAFGPATKFAFKTGSATGTGNSVGDYELKGPALLVPGTTNYGEYRQGF